METLPATHLARKRVAAPSGLIVAAGGWYSTFGYTAADCVDVAGTGSLTDGLMSLDQVVRVNASTSPAAGYS